MKKIGKAILLMAALILFIAIYLGLMATYSGFHSAVIGTTTTIFPSHTIIVGGISNANMNINQSILNQMAQCAESKIGGQTEFNINYCTLLKTNWRVS